MSLQHLDTALALCEKRDLHSLAGALRQALAALLPATDIRLLALSNANKDVEFNESNIQNASVAGLGETEVSTATLLAEDEDLVFCVRTQRQVIKDLAGQRRKLVLPIFGSRHVTSLLVIEGNHGLDRHVDIVTKLLLLYSNQAFLLSRSELDALTGLFNRQSFDERMRRIVMNTGRSDRRDQSHGQSCFVLMDIDHFKQVNDKFGHLYGDEVLLLFSRLMRRSFRQQDLLFRYGGEEFALVLHGIDIEMAIKVLERFRHSVESYEFPQIGRKTVSIGFVGMGDTDSIDTLIARADQALYYAKNHGRNRVCCYEHLIAEGQLQAVDVSRGDVELF